MGVAARVVITTVIAGTLGAFAPALPVQAHPDVIGDKHVCHAHWGKSKAQVKKQIKCLARKWHVSVKKALRVADCESDFRPGLRWRGYLGTYQHASRYWRARARTYLPRHPNASALDNRWNVMVTMKMVHFGSWRPWSCA